MIVQRIRLGPGQEPGEFVRFMRDEFLPAMRREPTRIGQATYVELVQGNTQQTLDEFVLLVEGLMSFHPGFVGEELEERFERFGPELDGPNDDFRSVAVWREPEESSPVI